MNETRTLVVGATIAGHTIDGTYTGTDDQIVAGIRHTIAGQLSWLARGPFSEMSDADFFAKATQWYNGQHPASRLVCPGDSTAFLDDAVRVGMAKVA